MTTEPRLDAVRRALGDPAQVNGWATVELDRAERELAAGAVVETAPDDVVLGARCRLVRRPGGDLVLLEPATEGPLAASLARLGEGVAVHYLVTDEDASHTLRALGLAMSSAGAGPLGPGRLLRGGPRWGPHIVIVTRAPATIAR